MDDRTVVSSIKQETCDIVYEQDSICNYVNVKEEHIDDLVTTCADDNMCLNTPVISGTYVKQEPCDLTDEQGNIHDYPSIKEENLDDPTVDQETKFVTDYVHNKVFVYETIINEEYIKEEPCDTSDESGSIHNNIHMKDCQECGEEYDLYCLKCPMLIRIFDSNNLDETDDTVKQTLPRKILDICETQSGWGIFALKAIPRGVLFGPFKGLDSTKHEVISERKLKNKDLHVTSDPEWIHWMQYIRDTDESSHQNLVPVKYEDGLYYRTDSYINMGDELLVHWNGNSKESEINEMKDGCWEICGSLDDSYACTFCCVGYKSIGQLEAHNSTCIEKIDKKGFGKEIVQCDVCKINLDEKEYSDYHRDRCYKSNEKYVFNSGCKWNRGRPLYTGNRSFQCSLCPYTATTNSILKQHLATHNGDEPPKMTKKWILKRDVAVRSNDKSFACTLCPYKTTTKSILKRHMGVHNDDKPFACTFCPYKARTKWNLNQHVAIHNDDRPFACTICPYKTKTKSMLKQHIGVHNDDKSFACTICPYRTKTKACLKLHIALHTDDKAFACALCPYKTMTKSKLNQHLVVHSGDRPFACALCPYKARTKCNLNQHVAIHNDDKPFPCTICPYKATTNCILKRHLAIHSDDKPFACALCPYKATTKPILKRHMAVHNDDKPFACTLCPYKSTTKSKLKQHIVVHSGDKPFACALCPYKTRTKSNLNQHIVIHNDDRPFACTLCPYKATRKSDLKQHIAVHNDDKSFACTLCAYKTKKNTNLKRHMAVHNDEKPFACSLCPFKATTKSKLNLHVVVHNRHEPFADILSA